MIISINQNKDPREVGGIEAFSRNLSKIFNKQIKFVTYYKLKKASQKHSLENSEIIYCINKNFITRFINKILKGYVKFYLMKSKIKKFKINTAILNYPSDCKILSKDKKVKKILVQHMSIDNMIFRKDYFDNDIDKINKICEEIDYFIALSPFETQDILKRLPLNKEKIKVIRHSTALKIRESNKRKNKGLIMISRLENKYKRIDLVIKAMKKLPDFTLNIYGDGPDKEYLEKICENKNYQNVFFHGEIFNIQEKLDENSIFIMSSDSEGYPISAIEAITRGLPLIIRNTFLSAKDLINKNGVLLDKEWSEIEFINAINNIYENYNIYSENSLKLAKRHTIENIGEEWKELCLKK